MGIRSQKGIKILCFGPEKYCLLNQKLWKFELRTAIVFPKLNLDDHDWCGMQSENTRKMPKNSPPLLGVTLFTDGPGRFFDCCQDCDKNNVADEPVFKKMVLKK